MGISLKNVVVGMFAIPCALTAFACGGTDAQVADESVGTDGSLLKEGACIADVMGGATSCKSADTWKGYAADACKAKGLELSDVSYGTACKGGFTEAKFSCCKVAPVPVPPKPGPDPVACFGDAQGGPTSCKSSATWKQYASDACKAKGAQLTQIGYAEECGKDLYRWSKYECCDATKPPPPPPPPPVCKTTVLGDATSCKPDATWKEYAFYQCKDAGLAFGDMSLGPSCGKDQSTSVKVTCCQPATPPPPPPPPPPVCDGRYEGGPTSCKSTTVWKQYASDACAKDGLKLGDIGYGASCGTGGDVSEIKYTCCK
ncbi:MAG: hypothetical protein JST00_33840 [Deltaproteobacteria bacterium]|nr:hypothetical protein [Deltaproteobacteria bacterium]